MITGPGKSEHLSMSSCKARARILLRQDIEEHTGALEEALDGSNACQESEAVFSSFQQMAKAAYASSSVTFLVLKYIPIMDAFVKLRSYSAKFSGISYSHGLPSHSMATPQHNALASSQAPLARRRLKLHQHQSSMNSRLSSSIDRCRAEVLTGLSFLSVN